MTHAELGPCPCGAIHFTCPRCDAQHRRGFLNGVDVFRCLRCGYVGHGLHPDEDVAVRTGDCIEIPCPCGADHAVDQPFAYAFVEESVRTLGPTVNVTVDGAGAWKVPRIWIGMHGFKATELPALAERYGWEQVR